MKNLFIWFLFIGSCLCIALSGEKKVTTSQAVCSWDIWYIKNATVSNSSALWRGPNANYGYGLYTFNSSYLLLGLGPAKTGTNYSLYTEVNDTRGNLSFFFKSSFDFPASAVPMRVVSTSPTAIFTPCQGLGMKRVWQEVYEDDTFLDNTTTFLQVTTFSRSYETQLFEPKYCAPTSNFVNFSPFFLTIDFTAETVTNRVYLNFTRGWNDFGVPFTSYCIARNSCDVSSACVQQGQLSITSGYDIVADLKPGLYFVILTVTNSGGSYRLNALSMVFILIILSYSFLEEALPPANSPWLERNYVYIIIAGIAAAVIIIVVVAVVVVRRRRRNYVPIHKRRIDNY